MKNWGMRAVNLYWSINALPLLKRLLLKLSLLLCLAPVLSAQAYQPFFPGKLHYFLSGSNYSVRVDSAGVLGGDSAFWMNEIALPPDPGCNSWPVIHFIPGQEGFFADHFIRKPDGSYQFVNRPGDTATFHTQVPTGMPWTFLSDSNLTAYISLRGQLNVGGTLDSVLVIDLSDGQQYQLTEHFGLYSGPNLSYYLGGDTLRAVTLAAQPETPDFKDYWDWQPGDVYNTSYGYPQAWMEYERFEILQRYESQDGDTLRFTVKHRYSIYYNPSPDTIHPPDSITITYTRLGNQFLTKATLEPDTVSAPDGYHWQQCWFYDPAYNGRRSLHFKYFDGAGQLDSCGYSFAIAPPCIDPMPENITLGLGPTYFQFHIGSTITTCLYADFHMVCHEQAGQDSLGPCPAEAIALPAMEEMVAVPKIHVWNDAHTGGAGIRWEDLERGIYRWQVMDLGGKVVWERAVSMSGAGNQSLNFDGSPGMYVLQISSLKEDWAERVKLVRMR
jgi:hypothetical protein